MGQLCGLEFEVQFLSCLINIEILLPALLHLRAGKICVKCGCFSDMNVMRK